LGYLEDVRVKDLPEEPVCPKCGSRALGVLDAEEGERLTKGEQGVWKFAQETAKLVAEFGKPACVALVGRRLRAVDARDVLSQEGKLSDRFYELVLEAERRALAKRFW